MLLKHYKKLDIFAICEIPDLLWTSSVPAHLDLGKCKQSQAPCRFYTSEAAGEILKKKKETKSC